jgi:hypothetical protein
MPVRERKEVQEMLRSLIRAGASAGLFTIFALARAHAALWPEQLADFHRTSLTPIRVTEQRAVWEESGLQAAEQAVYESPRGKCTATAWRLKDPTSALAIWQWKMPENAKPSPLEKNAVQAGEKLWLMLGNYILQYEGVTPTLEQVQLMYVTLPHLDQASLPALIGFLPARDLIPGSQRFVTGPASLEAFEKRIPPSAAGFHLGAEAQLARYWAKDGELNLAIFSYPTPHIARERIEEFSKLPGAVAKRSGPLVAVTIQPPSPDAAERLLAQVNYQATVTWNEKPLKPEPGVAEFLITAFTFIGVVLAFTILAGAGYAGLRIALRKWSGQPEDEPMVTLHLDK